MPTYDSYIRESGRRPGDTRVVVAMSGGVDSAVAAAALVRDGYAVAGATLKLWCFAEDFDGGRRCCSAESMGDAGAVCEALGIPHYVIDLRPEFKKEIVEPFCKEYLDGRTPNPCVACNTEIKFKALMEKARDMRADFISTGHYVRQVAAPGGGYRLLRGVDASKDQSYALWGLTQPVLRHTVFPIGWITKSEVRETARSLNLSVADKEESQDVCFAPGGDIGELIDDLAPDARRAGGGEVRNTSGQVIGAHGGYYRFTIGQRRGLGIALGRRQYVVGIDPSRNVVYVGDDSELMAQVAYASGFSLVEGLRGADADAVARVSAKIRYTHRAAPGLLEVVGEGEVRLTFDEPQRAITPGQSLVVYDGERLVGGGVIEKAER